MIFQNNEKESGGFLFFLLKNEYPGEWYYLHKQLEQLEQIHKKIKTNKS